jgi:hypothetical protein
MQGVVIDFLRRLFCRKARNRAQSSVGALHGRANENLAWRSDNWDEPVRCSEEQNRDEEIAQELDWFEN